MWRAGLAERAPATAGASLEAIPEPSLPVSNTILDVCSVSRFSDDAPWDIHRCNLLEMSLILLGREL